MYWSPVRSETGFVMLGKFWYRSHLFLKNSYVSNIHAVKAELYIVPNRSWPVAYTAVELLLLMTSLMPEHS
jgi:hypothetical protein